MELFLPKVSDFDDYLDDNVGQIYADQPLAQDWARISKVIEELGETIQEWIGCTGQNPRKGIYSTRAKMADELADTIITGILAMQHFTKTETITQRIIQSRWQYRLAAAHMLEGTDNVNG